ncbi:MAG: Trk system potassium transporter TrkH [Enterobacter sp.]|nr:Trk system potassium transporter TrkH [Enterobacter sp.]
MIPAEPVTFVEEIKKSRFITLLAHTDGVEAAKAFVESVRAEHPDARHHCVAWVAGPPDDSQQLGFSDDGEPAGTAGKPMLSQLMGSGVGEITAVVVRYYGGILLGTGGLVKAYGGGVQQALNILKTTRKTPLTEYTLLCDYAQLSGIEALLRQFNGVIAHSEYQAMVQLRVALPHFRAITRIVGLLVILFSGTMIIPGLVALIYRDGAGRAFTQTFFVALAIGSLLWWPNRRQKGELKSREGFLIVVLFWTVLGSVGSLPFIFSEQPNLSITDAFFESFSGLTTTGATTLVGLDSLPHAILFYRQMLQWFGGMGIIVLAVAILPILGVGGMQLYRAEMPGPLKDNKMRPRIAETAKTLWLIYVLLTVACALALWFAGMPAFDAIGHSFATIAIGGFSTHDASVGYFDSPTINTIIAIFLLISGCNYGLHFSLLSGRSLKVYWRDPEFRMFIGVQLTLVIICTLVLWFHDVYNSALTTLNQAFFQVVSMATTAGFTTDSIARWPLFLPVLLLCSAFIGGCAGSTGGGLKVIRILLLFKQGNRELKRLVHLGNRALPERILEAVWGFFSAYALVFIVSMLAIIATGVDDFSAFASVVATLNNLGPGLGVVADNFASMNPVAKWILIANMLFGRLEVFTLLVLFTPTFWRE